MQKDIENQPEKEKLNYKIQDGGKNLSEGQKQLICLARAIVKKPKVLLMDEATSNIDEKTDNLLQKMLRTEFANSTVITIAHRINTIIQYDRIMVMDKGKLVEFDTPLNLIKNKNSFFFELIKEYGEDYQQQLIQLAENRNKNMETEGKEEMKTDAKKINEQFLSLEIESASLQ